MLPLNPRANIFMYKRNSISFYTYFSPRMLYVYISIAESYRFKRLENKLNSQVR